MRREERREVWLIRTRYCPSCRPGNSEMISDTRYIISASGTKLEGGGGERERQRDREREM